MRVWHSLEQVPADLGRTVVVIGNFDGVHLGHQHVIGRARELADEAGIQLVAVTFDPHPMAVLRPDHAPLTLTDVAARCELLAAAGADDVFVIPFSREIAAWTPDEFIERVLVDGLHACAVVVGANFRFGNRAAGDVATLIAAGRGADFVVEGIALDGGPQVWSSTYVRTCLLAGDVEGAAEALGRPYAVTGEVVKGDQRGRELGFPTANVPTRGIAAPADGVYAGWLRRLPSTGSGRGTEPDSTPLPAAISVGTNPTFDGERERRVEAYVLDRTDLDLYGARVEISFVARIRGMVAFEGIEALVETMKGDVVRTREILGT
ncbi:MAG: riboflavin kinase / adenylyltransferase [Marmoricola sp.]|nr:riboflavin kinase / adenylyltransferase [Marmoricola sp.]